MATKKSKEFGDYLIVKDLDGKRLGAIANAVTVWNVETGQIEEGYEKHLSDIVRVSDLKSNSDSEKFDFIVDKKSLFSHNRFDDVNIALQPSLQRVNPWLSTPLIYYDDIVDRSHFNVGTGQIDDDYNGSGTMQPRYDYIKGFIPKSDPVTPVIMALRSGRLNQADISQLEKTLHEITQNSVDSDAKEEAIKAQKAIDDARQEVLDDAIGFDKSKVSKSTSS